MSMWIKILFSYLVLPTFLAIGVYGCSNKYLRFTEKRPVSSIECAECHPEIYDEWKQSHHAEAWNRKSYAKILSETGTVVCWSCHAPVVYSPTRTEKPPLRESNIVEGVNCTACHAEKCPHIQLIDPSFSKKDADDHSLKKDSAKICGACHETTYLEWERYVQKASARSRSKSCVQCHMIRSSNSTKILDNCSGMIVTYKYTYIYINEIE